MARDFFDGYDAMSASSWRTLPRRLSMLADRLLALRSFDDIIVDDDYDAVSDDDRRRLASAVFAMAPSTFLDDFGTLFDAMLSARHGRWTMTSNDDISMDDDDEVGVGGKDAVMEDGHVIDEEEESELCRSLSILGWVDYHLRRPLITSLHAATMNSIRKLVSGKYETSGLYDRVLSWKDGTLVPWTHGTVGDVAYARDNWDARLEYSASECFVRVRMGELFDLVTDYPDTVPAVSELTLALERTGRLWYQELACEFRRALVSRLLHPGAETAQIIEVYINTIRVLREMDPSGELLEVVTRPVRDYLSGRSDTIRCIITSLTDEENGGELYEELRRHDARPLEEVELDEDDDDEPPTFDWEPPPSILKRRGVITGQVGRVTSSSRRSGDILAMLVGIYGSKDLFVNEYRIMLADKLLGNLEYDTDKEVHNLELLKLRFGESTLRQCEVMVKDIDDSKRIHTNIHSTLDAKSGDDDGTPVVDAAIVSHIFWPALQREEMQYHPTIKSKLDEFSIEYAKLKNPRRLVWIKQLGFVELEVEAYEEDEDGNLTSHVKEVSCTPAHASLLVHFEDRSAWTSSALSIETEMSEDAVRKRMGFWVNQRVVRCGRQRGGEVVYTLVSVGDANAANDQSFQHDDEDQERAVSIGAHEEEEMKIYESYISGMLTNLGQLTLDRIHSMLKTFVAGSDHKYDKTPQQLAVFLQQLCREEKLECTPDGLYTRLVAS
jgi:anaphase-promoting complex subunit 2